MIVWSSILVALLIAVGITLVLVGALGWRRPGAAGSETVVLSAVFFFVVLFLATWAFGVWITPFGPVAWGVPWLGWLVVALVVALLLGSVSQAGLGRGSSRSGSTASTMDVTPTTGFGLMFWALVCALLLAAIAGSWRT